MNSNNIQIIETYKITTNKYIQIIKTGEKYLVIAVCKDTVTMLSELSGEELSIPDVPEVEMLNFKEIFEKAKNLKQKK